MDDCPARRAAGVFAMTDTYLPASEFDRLLQLCEQAKTAGFHLHDTRRDCAERFTVRRSGTRDILATFADLDAIAEWLDG